MTVTGGLPPWLVLVWNDVPPEPEVLEELEADAPGPEVKVPVDRKPLGVKVVVVKGLVKKSCFKRRPADMEQTGGYAVMAAKLGRLAVSGPRC